MEEKLKKYFEGLEKKEKIPRPETRDLIILDGRFAQYGGGDQYIFIRFIDDNSKIVISAEDWNNFSYEKPPKEIFLAKHLVEQNLMTEEELQKVYWGPEQKVHPYLKGEVGFFGSYKKSNNN